jgi:hypothetical protein
MPAPDIEPIDTRILAAIAAQLAQITTANGFYNDVAGAGIEPLAFDENDNYPQIVVREETKLVSGTKPSGFDVTRLLALTGFMPFQSGNAMRDAGRLRDDIEVRAQQLKSADFKDANGVPMLSSIELSGTQEIKNSDEVENIVEVIVRVQVTYRRFFQRPAGGL